VTTTLDLPAVATDGLGKRFGSKWALKDCTIRVPSGRVSALVGPNGAGKTTLLRMLVGLSEPTAGSASVEGRAPGADAEFLASIGYLAQEAPLYRRLTVADHLDIGRHLNPRWHDATARDRLSSLGIPFEQRVDTLSGGERSQVALCLALAKRPDVLLLDEPVAALDPLARREFLASLAAAVGEADGELTVLMSSHLLHDLERVCDHLVLLTASRVQLCDDIDHVLAQHRSLVGPRRALTDVEPSIDVITATQSDRQTRLLARVDGAVLDPAWEVGDVGLEDIVVAYMSVGGDDTARSLQLVGGGS
jgi:ABC-2 type transport system ATP-binding protein